MRKSDKIADKLASAEVFIEKARQLIIQAFEMDENGDGEVSLGDAMKACDDMVEMTNQIGFDICYPLQMEEDERDQEILALEARLAELRRQG